MHKIINHPNYAVFDDFLPSNIHDELWNYCQNDEYKIANSNKWSKVWRLGDGNPMYGSLIFSNNMVAKQIVSKRAYSESEYLIAPLNNVVDAFFNYYLKMVIPDVSSIIGKQDTEWIGSTFKPYIYPEGSGLSWHQDGEYSGAFIYYVNPVWKANWGGELFLANHKHNIDIKRDYIFSNGYAVKIPANLDSTHEDSILLEEGYGTYIHPKPNRLVVLGGGIAHKINKVSSEASSCSRVSCSGFFIKK